MGSGGGGGAGGDAGGNFDSRDTEAFGAPSSQGGLGIGADPGFGQNSFGGQTLGVLSGGNLQSEISKGLRTARAATLAAVKERTSPTSQAPFARPGKVGLGIGLKTFAKGLARTLDLTNTIDQFEKDPIGTGFKTTIGALDPSPTSFAASVGQNASNVAVEDGVEVVPAGLAQEFPGITAEEAQAMMDAEAAGNTGATGLSSSIDTAQQGTSGNTPGSSSSQGDGGGGNANSDEGEEPPPSTPPEEPSPDDPPPEEPPDEEPPDEEPPPEDPGDSSDPDDGEDEAAATAAAELARRRRRVNRRSTIRTSPIGILTPPQFLGRKRALGA